MRTIVVNFNASGSMGCYEIDFMLESTIMKTVKYVNNDGHKKALHDAFLWCEYEELP